MTSINFQQNQKTERLTDAFRIFNQLSENLALSYQGLEEQVSQLNRELAAARSERISTLIEKEKLANRLQKLLAALPAAVLVLNAYHQVIDCNQQAIEFLGEPVLGENWQDLMQRSMQTVIGSPCERQLRDGRKVNITVNLLNQDAEQIILLSDVSELRCLQDLLAQQKHLSSMGEMVASLAHQVRTPLATAILYVSQLGKPALTADKRQVFTDKILERLQYLERQVNDMLMYAKQGRLAMQSFQLTALFSQIAENMQTFSGHLQIETQLADVNLLGNQDALYGALMNLINNAVEAGATKINMQAQQLVGKQICIAITDNGPGISPSQQQHIFEPFYTTKKQGTGLGLAVVDSVIKAHNGQITCDSTLGSGSTFTLTLPSHDSFGLSLSAAGISQEKDYATI